MQASLASPDLGTAQSLLAQAERALHVVRAAGADDAEVRVARNRGLELEWRDGRLEKVSETAERSLAVALYVDGRFSTHGTNDVEPTRLKRFLEEAVAMTRLLEPDPFRRIPDPSLFANRPAKDLDLVDARLAALSREERIEACREMHDRGRGDPSVISVTSHFSDDHGLSARVTSNGFSGSREATSVGYGATVTIREGEDKKPEDHWYVAGTHLQGLPTADAVGREALRRVLARRGAAQAGSRRTTMVVHPEAGASLIGRVLGALTAGAIQQKRSFLAGRQGQKIGSSALTITDDPLVERGLASRLYDSEGISAHRLPVVQDGVLENYYVDTYYGRKLGWAPTTGTPSNLTFRQGTKDLAGLVKDAGEGLLVTSWLGGNANGTTGDFSFGLRGHVIRGGAVAEPISEMNVTGNYLDLLQHLVAVGNDPVPWYSCRTPTLVFEGVQFSGS